MGIEKMEGQSQKRQEQSLEACGGDDMRNMSGSSASVIHQPSGLNNPIDSADGIIERLVARPNMLAAYHRVVSNKGAPGVDGITVEGLKGHLQEHWEEVKESLLTGRYKPSAVRRVDIPKSNGGTRSLGIPTVMDRLIQQALQQILSGIFEPTFSQHSYGFRAGRSAQQAVRQARSYIRKGRRWVVDMDLEKFFDKVNHDKLIARIRRQVDDKRVIALIRSYLRAGVMADGLITVNREGMPQGGPLSPLLSNIMLTDLDNELERRGHAFCRYADDCNIYVRSEKAGLRLLKSISKYVEKKLKLKVNEAKSAVDRPWKRNFLGFSFTSQFKTRTRVGKESVKKVKAKIKKMCCRARGGNIHLFIELDLNPVIRGWSNYFKHADTNIFAKDLDKWIRHRIRVVHWRQWSRAKVRYRKLCGFGVEPKAAFVAAYCSKGPWRVCTRYGTVISALTYTRIKEMGLVSAHSIISKH